MIQETCMTRDTYQAVFNVLGFNPTQGSLSRHWPPSTKNITYSQFCNITEIEPIPTEKTLLHLFEKLDEKKVGYLNHDEFLMNMSSRGDTLPAGVLENLMENEAYNQDRKFYYKKFCNEVLETSNKLASLALDKLKRDEDELQVNSKTYKVRRKTGSPNKSISNSPLKSNCNSPQKSIESPTKSVSQSISNSYDIVTSPTWVSNVKSKGCFYFENENIISHQYSLTVKKRCYHKISIEVCLLIS